MNARRNGVAAVLALVVLVVVASCGDEERPRAIRGRVVDALAFPTRADVFVGREAFLLVERDIEDEVVDDPTDDVHSRLVVLSPAGERVRFDELPKLEGPDLAEPSAMQLPDGGWLLAGLPCTAEGEGLSATCDGPAFLRRFDPDGRTWSDVGKLPGELLRGAELELVGQAETGVVLRATARWPEPRTSTYWAVDVDEGMYRELWRAPRDAERIPGDCIADDRLTVLVEDGASAHRTFVVDLATGEARTQRLDLGEASVAALVCDERTATLVTLDGTTFVTTAIDADGSAGARREGPTTDPTAFPAMSNRSVAVFQTEVGGGPGGATGERIDVTTGDTSIIDAEDGEGPSADAPRELRLDLLIGGSWRSTTLPGEDVQFVHPDLTGRHLLLEHTSDRWTVAAVG